MITLDELVKIMRAAHTAANKRGEVYDGWDMDRAGAAAVVRALEPVIADTVKSVLQSGQIMTGEHLKCAAWIIKSILEDAPTGDTGVVSHTTVSISPASFCEWFDGHCDDWEHDHGVSSKAFFGKKPPTHCHYCNKPIKFMAGETSGQTDRDRGVGADLSVASGLSPAASFCEWKQIAQTNHYIRSCNGDEQFYDCFSYFSDCHHCKKPIKFMAGETVMTAVGEDLSPSSGLSPAASFDLLAHLRNQVFWSTETFGPGARQEGIIDHIKKELTEIEAAQSVEARHEEWIDVIILALDGAWRAGMTPREICDGIVTKHKVNQGRKWPDWRTAEPNKAIHHVKDAASFCEWRESENRNEYIRSCSKSIVSDQYGRHRQWRNCPSCGKAIKFMADDKCQESFGVMSRSERLMADAPTRKDEDGSHSGEKLSVATHTSAATNHFSVRKVIAAEILSWGGEALDDCYPSHRDGAFDNADRIMSALRKAGYKILPRTVNKAMLEPYKASDIAMLAALQSWQELWDLA